MQHLNVANMTWLTLALSSIYDVICRDTLSTLWEFIPQMVFLNFIFGWLCILMIAKWANGSTADLYHVMINMMLKPGSMDKQGMVWSGWSGQGSFQVRC